MSVETFAFKTICNRSDRKRNKKTVPPSGITRKDNISYGPYGKWNLLDVYYPEGTDKPLPTIVSIHGGGYIYGTKEVYQYYGMSMAKRGFTFVNFNYRLAPGVKFPSPIVETNLVMEWICKNAAQYFIDTDNIFIVGDSAGAQLASQYSTIVTNPEYAKLFDFKVPNFKLKAIALNCGMYDKLGEGNVLPGVMKAYFGKDPKKHGEKINVLKYITSSFPPSFIISAENDFLLDNAKPMHEFLQTKGVESICKIYGTKEQKEIAHVFHINILLPLADQCNDEECDFFKKHI